MQMQNINLWNNIHLANIVGSNDYGFQVNIKNIIAFLPKEELQFIKSISPESLEIYLENPQRPTASIIKSISISEIDKLIDVFNNKRPVFGVTIGKSKKGLIIALLAKNYKEVEEGFGIRALMPLCLNSYNFAAVDENTFRLFTIENLDLKNEDIIVNPYISIQEENLANESIFMKNIKAGDIVTGVIKNITTSGILVCFSEMSAFLDPADIFNKKLVKVYSAVGKLKIGQNVKVKILELDRKNKKIKVEPDQSEYVFWKNEKKQDQHRTDDVITKKIISRSSDSIKEKLISKSVKKIIPGDIVKAKIVKIKEYGLFLQLDKHTTGLVHVSELSWIKRNEQLHNLYKENQVIDVIVLEFNTEHNRMHCSVKKICIDPWIKYKDKYLPGTHHSVLISKVNTRGLEIELEVDLFVFCLYREIGKIIPKQGQKVEVEVVEFDSIKHKANLRIKSNIKHEFQNRVRVTLGDILQYKRKQNDKI